MSPVPLERSLRQQEQTVKLAALRALVEKPARNKLRVQQLTAVHQVISAGRAQQVRNQHE